MGRRASVALAVTAGAVITCTLTPGPTTTSRAASAPAMGGHLTVVGDSEVGSPWTPAEMRCDSYCFVRARAFFDSVAAFGADGQVHGMLAESIVPNDDHTQWTVTVREGISFTDGTPVDADAVIYNLQAGSAGALVGGWLTDIAKVPSPDDPGEMILKIDKLDEMSFVIHTGENGDPDKPLPWRSFPHLFTGQWGLIASPQWLEAVVANPELATEPIGSGPFVVDSFEPRGSLEVSRNPDYWMTDDAGRQLPYLDSMTFRVIEDAETSVEALQAGDVDVVSTANGAAISSVDDRTEDISVTVQSSFVDTHFLLIDLDKPGPLQDRRVRCALSSAIDRDQLNDATTNGFNPTANGLFSPGQQGHLADNGLSLEQDLDAAAAAIAEYEAETGSDVEFTLGHTPVNSFAQAAEMLIGWWSTIGVDVDDRTIPQNDIINLALVGAPEFEVFIWRQHAGVFVDEQYLWWHSENAFPDGEVALNFGRLRDPEVDAALDAARTATTAAEESAAAEEINRIIARECYAIPLNWARWAMISDRDVEGLGDLTLPDGTAMLSAVGLSGQFWTQTLYLADD